jgi:hypothetical protein
MSVIPAIPGKDQEGSGSKPAWTKCYQDPFQQTSWVWWQMFVIPAMWEA